MKNHNHTKRQTQEQIYHNAKVTLDKFPSLSKEVPVIKQGEAERKMAEKNEPDHIRVGAISVTIWTNGSDKGDFKTITMQRGYKDKDGNWQNTTSLKVNDIPKAILALQKAYEKIVIKETE